jgi:hypothetical protein
MAVSLTKVKGSHTMKGGYYLNHSYKAQNVGAGGIANLSFQGYVNFGNDSNNTLDSGFGYSNAALGIFTQYLQASKFIEGSLLYNQQEFYVQDNWKMSDRITLDYGVRFVNQQPQHDQTQQMSNFFPTSGAVGPGAHIAGAQRRDGVSGNIRNAGSAKRPDPDGAGCGQHASRHRTPFPHGTAERHYPSRGRHREDELRVAEARWAASSAMT